MVKFSAHTLIIAHITIFVNSSNGYSAVLQGFWAGFDEIRGNLGLCRARFRLLAGEPRGDFDGGGSTIGGGSNNLFDATFADVTSGKKPSDSGLMW